MISCVLSCCVFVFTFIFCSVHVYLLIILFILLFHFSSVLLLISFFISLFYFVLLFFFTQKPAYELRISDWSSDVCSSDLLSAAPTEHVSFYGSLAYTDTTYLSYPEAPQAPERANEGGNQDLTGERLPGVPKFTYTLGGDASAPVGSLGGRSLAAYAHADYSHRSSFNTSSSNSIYADVPAFGIANARIGIRTEDGLFDLSRSEEHTSELTSLMRISYAVF